MSLKHGILGLLTYGSMSGYELMKIFDESLSFFWTAQTSQIYRELDNLEKKAWISTQSVQQSGKPNKKMVTLTEAGKDELRKWLDTHACSKSLATRDEMTMRVFLSSGSDQTKLIEELRDYSDKNRSFIEGLEKVENELDARIAYVGKPEEKIYWQMALKRGIINARANIEWVDTCFELLSKEGEELV